MKLTELCHLWPTAPLCRSFTITPMIIKKYMNKEGELIAANHQWHTDNNTYGFSKGLGIFLMTLVVLTALYKAAPLAV